jgi:hypothetical protein
MAVTTTKTNKPINPRGNDQSPKGYNRAALYSGKALDFDGVNDEISIGSANFLGLGTGSFSFAWYINSSESVDFQCVIDYRHTSGIGVLIDHRLGGIGGALQTAEGNFAFDVTSATSSVSGDVFDGKWHHVVFVADRSTSNTRVTFYIDGQLHYYDVNTNAQTSTIEDGQQMYFGGQGGTQYVDASLSSLKAFNVALTAAQVSDLYNNPEKIVPTGVADSTLKLYLPMMEGAGTTAYDGSGNGNHGTISGATWTHGVGSPVAQTAVIDWNKAKNDAGRSQEFDNAYWGKGGLIVTANATTAPDGTQTADKLAAISTANSNAEIYRAIGFTANNAASVFVKSDTAQWVTLGTNRTLGRVVFFDIINGVVGTESTGYTGAITEYLNGWYKLDVYWDGTATTQTYWDLSIADADNAFGVTAGKSIFAWGAYANLSDTTIGPYIATLTDSAITSPVLLPQGLTSGRDITGVNLFENVRKQGALNLDGNSWAEVHDNASLDVTDAITLEAWVYWDDIRAQTGIMGRWGATTATRNYMLYVEDSTSARLYINTAFAEYTSMTTGWRHIVGTYDKANMRLYVDGTQVAVSANTAAIATSTEVLEIGRYRYATDVEKEYTNDIAQPRIYNRALTAEEVARNFAAHKSIYTNS